jgi:F-type H+-transporting ATPase subunit delta
VIPGVIAKRYATALLELGSESGQLDAFVDDIGKAAATYDASPELRSTLDDPLIPLASKRAILTDICERLGLGVMPKNAISLLLDRRRIRALPAIAGRLREMADAKRGILRAEVLTAMPLPEEYFEQLQKQLERITGRRVALDRKLEETLVAGVVVRVGDTVYDGSLVARIRQMKEQMLPN